MIEATDINYPSNFGVSDVVVARAVVNFENYFIYIINTHGIIKHHHQHYHVLQMIKLSITLQNVIK